MELARRRRSTRSRLIRGLHRRPTIYDLQRRLEIAGGETAFRFRNDARDAAGNDTAPVFPGPRSQVDNPVRLCDGAHVMFDDYDGIAGVYESLQVLHQPV